jgi:hypothetical protein
MADIKKENELENIVKTVKPYESAWCASLQCTVVVHETGYTLQPYDVETDRLTGSIVFVPFPGC